jgi:hypothetical protein
LDSTQLRGTVVLAQKTTKSLPTAHPLILTLVRRAFDQAVPQLSSAKTIDAQCLRLPPRPSLVVVTICVGRVTKFHTLTANGHPILRLS